MIFVGEKGDSDHEQLLQGLHKTVIIKGICRKVGSEDLIRQDDGYDKHEEVVDQDSPNVAIMVESFGDDGIPAILTNLGIKY